MKAFFITIYYITIGGFAFSPFMPFAKVSSKTTTEINPNWSWNDKHVDSVTTYDTDKLPFFECVEENPFILILFISLIIVSILLWALGNKKEYENIMKPLTVITICLGLALLLCQWAIGFSFWGTLLVFFICYCPLKYKNL